MQGALRGQIAVVTGSARGIGRAVALGLAGAGASVLVTDRLGYVDQTAREIEEAGGQAHSVVADLRDTSAIRKIFDTAVARFGTVDILVNVAGMLVNLATTETSEEAWDLHTDVNYKAVFFCSQAAARIMIPKRRGKIVNISSTSAFVASRTAKVAYDSTKGAVRQLTVSMAHELAPFNIHVNSVAPGTIATDLNAARLASEEERNKSLARIPLGRIGSTADIVGPVCFLCSSASDYVVGHTLVVDGGWLT